LQRRDSPENRYKVCPHAAPLFARALRHIQEAVEFLTTGIEAELDPPPVFKAAFARNRQALRGWKLAPQSLRRQYLIDIFRSPYPETRARNLENAVRQSARYFESHRKSHDVF
jgi:hypothetical protein